RCFFYFLDSLFRQNNRIHHTKDIRRSCTELANGSASKKSAGFLAQTFNLIELCVDFAQFCSKEMIQLSMLHHPTRDNLFSKLFISLSNLLGICSCKLFIGQFVEPSLGKILLCKRRRFKQVLIPELFLNSAKNVHHPWLKLLKLDSVRVVLNHFYLFYVVSILGKFKEI